MLLHRVLVALWIVLIAASLDAAPAHASEGREEVTLQEVLARSSAVVLAEPATPSQRTVPVSITPPGERPNDVTFPPYQRHLQRWRVQKVLFGPPALADQVLEVDEAEWDMRLTVHRRYYVERVSKIPIYRGYSPSYRADRPPATPARIVMLRGGPEQWSLAADNALEAPDQQARVEEALRKAKKR